MTTPRFSLFSRGPLSAEVDATGKASWDYDLNMAKIDSLLGTGLGGVVGGTFGEGPSTGYTITNSPINQPWNGNLIIGVINTQNGSNSAFTAGAGFSIAALSGVSGVSDVMALEYLAGSTNANYSSALTVPSGTGNWNAAIAAFAATNPTLMQATGSITSGVTSLAYGANNAAGNCLVAVFRYTNTSYAFITSVTDTLGNIWVRAGVPSVYPSSPNLQFTEVWYAVNAKAGANMVSATFGGGAANQEIIVAEFSGVALFNPLIDYEIASGTQTTSIPGATTYPQFNYSAINNTTGKIDFSGTDAAALVNSCLGNMVNAGGGVLYIKNGIYNLLSMTQETVAGFTTNFYSIGIPSISPSSLGTQFHFIGESKPIWAGEIGQLGIDASFKATNGVIFKASAMAFANVGTNTASLFWQRPSGGAATQFTNENFFSNIAVRFPTNQIPNWVGFNQYEADTVAYDNVLQDLDILYATIATNPAPASGTVGITTALSGSGNVQYIRNSYAVGMQIGYDIGEHTRGENITSIYCTRAGRATSGGHNILLTNLIDQENSNGWQFSSAGISPAEINIVGYDIEIAASGTFTRVSDLSESTPGTWRGLITYTKTKQSGGLAGNASPNLFGANNANGGDGFVVIYNGGIRGTGYTSLSGQTGSIGSANLLPHPIIGTLYRVMWYLVCSAAGTGGTVTVAITYNDGTAETFTSSTLSLAAQGALSGELLIKVASGVVAFSTTVTNSSGNPQYSLDIRTIPLG